VNKGILYGVGAYLMWGFFPIYFKAIQAVPSLQTMFHRVVWSSLFLVTVTLIRRDWTRFRKSIAKPRVLLVYLLSAILLAVNWLVYIYGINSEQIVETSLGYFINPLFSVALGVIFLRERLRPMQWVPIGLAAIGVLYLTLQYGSLPWIALALAFSFGMYGLIKKIAPLGALHGVTLETGILFLPALSYLVYVESQSTGAFGHLGWDVTLLLALSGIITALPLLLFASAAQAIPLVLVGILQYIAPTVQFLLGVFLYQEPFTLTLLVGFIIIWLALLIFTMEGVYTRRKRSPVSVQGY
jgi:chloramphenicol-sensitive protein RarD